MVSILMALDRDVERAAKQVGAIETLASATSDLTVYALHVFENNPEGASVNQIKAVREAAEQLEAAGVEVELVEESGDPATVILDVATEHDVDQICIGGRKRSPAGKALFGSVTQDVILNGDRPVLVCGQQRAE